MAQGSAAPTPVEAQLGQELAQLQQSASVVASQLKATNRVFYKHLAELYLWWRSASAVEGYLEAEYAKVGKRLKKKVTYGISFAPLFWLTWGSYNGLTDDKCRRWSIVLNRFHEVYEAEKQYRTDTVEKLGNYLHLIGGVDGVVNDGKVTVDDDDIEDDVDDDVADAKVIEPAVSVDTLLAQLYESAKTFYGSVQAPPIVNLGVALPVTPDGMSVVLVNRVGGKYQLVGASNDDGIARALAMHTYLNDYAALPPSMRCLSELISTQCLPLKLQAAYDALVDPAATGRAYKSIRRVMYRHGTGEFVLSPVRAESGVVTVAKPSSPVLAGVSSDVYLSTRSRRALERRLISGRDFNLYEPTHSQQIPAYLVSGLASHAMRIQHRYAPRDYLHLDFWQFRNEPNVPHAQLALRPSAEGLCKWRAALGLAWFRTLAMEFTLHWAQSHGKHIKRPHQRVMQVDFGMDALTLKFVHRQGVFEVEHVAALDGATPTGSILNVNVLTKDFVVAMQSVADLGVVDVVGVLAGDDVLLLDFATSAATYKIAIPTCALNGTRSESAFEEVTATPITEDEHEAFNDQVEGDFDEAR